MKFMCIFVINLILKLPLPMNSEVVYTIVYGKVNFGTPTSTKTTVSYKECLELCKAIPTCILAFGNKNCRLYDFGDVYSVSQVPSDKHGPEDIVAFRENRDTTVCPVNAGSNQPTFDGYPATGIIQSDNTSNFYKINLDPNGTTWNYETKSQPSQVVCDQWWFPYTRSFGIYCLRWIDRQFGSDCGAYSSPLATNPYFTGIESVQEFEEMWEGVSSYGIIYINAKVTPECLSTGNCDNIMQGTYLTPPNRIPWLEGYPNATAGDCVAAYSFDNKTFGLINTDCNNATNGATYCVYLLT